MSISAGLRVGLVTFSLIFASSYPSFSQDSKPSAQTSEVDNVDPARLAAAREVLRLTNSEKMLSETFPVIIKQAMGSVVALIQPPNMSPEQQKQYNDIADAISSSASEFVLSKKTQLLDVSAAVYARTFTVEELNALSEFYGTPAGQKFVSASPELMQEMMPLMVNVVFDKPIEVKGEISDDTLAAAKEMLKVSKTEEMLDRAMTQFGQNPPIAPADADPQVEAEAQKYSQDVSKKFQQRREELLDALAMVWAKKFTAEEMNAVTEFYRTEAGEKIITAMPKMMVEIQNESQAFYQELTGEMIGAIQKQMKDKGIEPK